jgi:transposase
MKEADRLKVIWQVITGKLRIKEATAQLFLSRRQVIRIRNRVKAEGNAGIIHRRRGKPSNHRLPQGLLQQAIEIVRERYWDFGPTFANEYLRKKHGIVILRSVF